MNVLKPGIHLRGTCQRCECEFECLPKEARLQTLKEDELAREAVLAHLRQPRKKRIAVADCPECGAETLLTDVREHAPDPTGTVRVVYPDNSWCVQPSAPMPPQVAAASLCTCCECGKTWAEAVKEGVVFINENPGFKCCTCNQNNAPKV